MEGWILRVSSQFRIRGSFIFTVMSSLGRKRMKTLVYLDVTPYFGLDLSKRPSYCSFGVNELKMREGGSPKRCCLSTKLHGVISQKSVLLRVKSFISSFVVAFDHSSITAAAVLH